MAVQTLLVQWEYSSWEDTCSATEHAEDFCRRLYMVERRRIQRASFCPSLMHESLHGLWRCRHSFYRCITDAGSIAFSAYGSWRCGDDDRRPTDKAPMACLLDGGCLPMLQVAAATVVYKTRARRLYDIANALAALGLVEKVQRLRSHDVSTPNDHFCLLYYSPDVA